MNGGRGLLLGLMIVLLCVVGTAKAQSYRQLTLEDFGGAPGYSGDVVAETACSISLQYDVHARNNYYQLTFHVGLEVDHLKSWLDRTRLKTRTRIEEILKHEQGHYTISFLEQQELLRIFNRTRFDENYKTEVLDIFDRIHNKYQQLNKDYDEDTDNSRNRVQQASWDKYFERKLAYMPPSRDDS